MKKWEIALKASIEKMQAEQAVIFAHYAAEAEANEAAAIAAAQADEAAQQTITTPLATYELRPRASQYAGVTLLGVYADGACIGEIIPYEREQQYEYFNSDAHAFASSLATACDALYSTHITPDPADFDGIEIEIDGNHATQHFIATNAASEMQTPKEWAHGIARLYDVGQYVPVELDGERWFLFLQEKHAEALPDGRTKIVLIFSQLNEHDVACYDCEAEINHF